ncbi:hypothetical protein [Arthrobacter globiformis]|uniref:hypothetical protein n=1 Tax=Arthrobacter globiformis TaxID=1665 RepID=UPI00278D4471|nr:hypothetical protein [Arthrobacter globiformis]MDQ0618542.1 putative dienelactone hydrolase [Arthrobacter globiformis]
MPAGQIFHAAGPSTGGWTILAVHESKASWEQFRDNTLLPRFQQGIEGGFTSMPEEAVIDVYKLMPLGASSLSVRHSALALDALHCGAPAPASPTKTSVVTGVTRSVLAVSPSLL